MAKNNNWPIKLESDLVRLGQDLYKGINTLSKSSDFSSPAFKQVWEKLLKERVEVFREVLYKDIKDLMDEDSRDCRQFFTVSFGQEPRWKNDLRENIVQFRRNIRTGTEKIVKNASSYSVPELKEVWEKEFDTKVQNLGRGIYQGIKMLLSEKERLCGVKH